MRAAVGVVMSWPSRGILMMARHRLVMTRCRAGLLDAMGGLDRHGRVGHIVAHGTRRRSAGDDEMHNQQRCTQSDETAKLAHDHQHNGYRAKGRTRLVRPPAFGSPG